MGVYIDLGKSFSHYWPPQLIELHNCNRLPYSSFHFASLTTYFLHRPALVLVKSKNLNVEFHKDLIWVLCFYSKSVVFLTHLTYFILFFSFLLSHKSFNTLFQLDNLELIFGDRSKPNSLLLNLFTTSFIDWFLWFHWVTDWLIYWFNDVLIGWLVEIQKRQLLLVS